MTFIWPNDLSDRPYPRLAQVVPAPGRLSVMGLDLGQANDRSAACVIERQWATPDFIGPVDDGLKLHPNIRRWDEGTPYDEVVEEVLDASTVTVIAVEYNGVGRPVVDFLRKRYEQRKARGEGGFRGIIVPITTAASHTAAKWEAQARGGGSISVPKVDLVSSILLCLQERKKLVERVQPDGQRVRVSVPAGMTIPNVPGVADLFKEVKDFQMRYSAAARVGFGNEPGAGKHDDIIMCLVSDTPVLTDSGTVPIKSVTVGDQVMTRSGWRSVIWSGQTGTADTILIEGDSPGFKIECTPEHQVFCCQRGWVPAGEVGVGEEVLSWQRWRQGCGMDASGGGIRTRSTPVTGGISSATRSGKTHRSIFTEKCGERPTAQFRRGMTFIIGTGILPTIGLITWNVLRVGNMPDCMAHRLQLVAALQSTWNICDASDRLLMPLCVPGPLPTRVSGSCERMVPSRSLASHCLIWSAVSAEVRSSLFWPGPCTAPVGAVSGLILFDPSTPTSAVGAVEAGLPGSADSGFVPLRVRRITVKSRNVPVYDLTVDGCPEFVAGGLLVHNSLALACWYHKRKKQGQGVWI